MIRIDDSYRTLINNADKIVYSERKEYDVNLLTSLEDIINRIKQAQVFVMDKISTVVEEQTYMFHPTIESMPCELDAPFSNCLIQLEDISLKDKNIKAFYFVTEVAPKEYEGFIIVVSSLDVTIRKIANFQMETYVRPYIDKINTSNTVYIESRVRSKSKGSAPRVSNESIIYVSSNRVYSNDVVLVGGRISKVSCKFMVRGHWRKLQDSDKLGKDRAGIYNTVGYTWITEHVKGADNTNEVKQLRVVAC
jgi:hypothetical protein